MVDIKEIKGVTKKRRNNYKKYIDAINRINLIGWIKDEISKRSDRTIVVKIDDVIKEMGSEFKNISYSVLYQPLRVILFQNGIFLSMATHKDGDKAFILRDVRKGEKLPQSYFVVKGKKEKEEMEQEEGDRKEERKIDRKEEIKMLKEILHGRLGNKSCMIEIFKFNWNTLTWRMTKRSSARTYLKLLEIIMKNTSNSENRCRIEVTPIQEFEKMVKKIKDGEKGFERYDNIEDFKGRDEKKGDKGEGTDKLESDNGESDSGQEKLECPRCGSKNIKTWPTVQVIKTRSGVRKLRHRCVDCNETFTDEDIGIKKESG